jgi:hypothetical protein
MSDGRLLAAGQQRLAKVNEPDPADMARREADAAAGQLPETGGHADATVPASSAPAGTAPLEHWPVHLDRSEPLIPLNVKIRWSSKHGLELLAGRDGTTMQAEVDEALAAHFERKGFVPPSFWQRG